MMTTRTGVPKEKRRLCYGCGASIGLVRIRLEDATPTIRLVDYYTDPAGWVWVDRKGDAWERAAPPPELKEAWQAQGILPFRLHICPPDI